MPRASSSKKPPKTRSRKVARKASGKRRRRVITAEDLLRLKLVGTPRISPDGQRVVFTVKTFGKKNNYLTNLWMADVGGKPRRFTRGDKDGTPVWSPMRWA